jgi:hypothetical protein
MPLIPIPPDSFLHGLLSPFVRGDKKVYRSLDGKHLFVWDGLHGHVEGYTQRGYHIGVFHAVTGTRIGDAIKGRTINV